MMSLIALTLTLSAALSVMDGPDPYAMTAREPAALCRIVLDRWAQGELYPRRIIDSCQLADGRMVRVYYDATAPREYTEAERERATWLSVRGDERLFTDAETGPAPPFRQMCDGVFSCVALAEDWCQMRGARVRFMTYVQNVSCAVTCSNGYHGTAACGSEVASDGPCVYPCDFVGPLPEGCRRDCEVASAPGD